MNFFQDKFLNNLNLIVHPLSRTQLCKCFVDNRNPFLLVFSLVYLLVFLFTYLTGHLNTQWQKDSCGSELAVNLTLPVE